jgi:hypothetical protein
MVKKVRERLTKEVVVTPKGVYNPGDPNHTSDVLNSGKNFWNETTGNLKKWWNSEGKYWYNNPNGPQK